MIIIIHFFFLPENLQNNRADILGGTACFTKKKREKKYKKYF